MPLTNNGNVLAQGVGDMWEDAEPTIEFVILAEHAEVIHGKLYLMGGGWENITVQDFAAPVVLPLAVSLLSRGRPPTDRTRWTSPSSPPTRRRWLRWAGA